jgi:two-component system NtrC family sensor kinase
MKAKRLVILIILIGFTVDLTVAQDFISTGILQDIDSVRNVLKTSNNDTVRVDALVRLSNYYKFNRPDSAIYYSTEALTLANQIKYEGGIIDALNFLSLSHITLGNYPRALQIALQGIKLADNYKLELKKAVFLNIVGMIYNDAKEYEKALKPIKEALKIREEIDNKTSLVLSLSNIGSTYRELSKYDSALFYLQKALTIGNDLNINWLIGGAVLELGKTYQKMGDYNLALSYYNEGLELLKNATSVIALNYQIAQIYQLQNKPDSSLYYGLKSFEIAKNTGIYNYISEASLLLSDIYKKTEPQRSLEYAKISIAYRDSLDLLRNHTSLETLVDFDEQERQYELDAAKASYQNQLRINIFLGASFTFLVIAFFLIRSNKQKQKAKLQIEGAYNQLKSTQAQLIQSEKMASLGELTSGIAHEIQNPLNFVNNFSEVSAELVDEMNEEIEKGDFEEVKFIASDLKENLSKINHHGKRADAIVKGMLEHSRANKGEKAPTDLNALTDEYVRLSYHGLRAKDNSFNADFKLELDPDLPKVNVVASDIGRVILNLVNNAFYAVNEKSKSGIADYQPEVIVSSKKTENGVELSVKDNGPGIPDSIKEKIFQPFFTTKPTGQGTGLGLSLSYDIVKAHGGELKVETKHTSYSSDAKEIGGRGEGTEFRIKLPC